LNVMAEFVCDHIGLSKVAGGFEFPPQFVKECEIEI
jgi:hypothetical protein